MENYTKLNLACGRNLKNKFPKPWFNVDVDGDCADFNCDISKLPKDWTNKFNEVRASHVLEHFFMDEFDLVISEWLRVLKPGGSLRIIVPDLEIIIQALLSGTDSKNRNSLSISETTPILSQIYGVGYESRLTSSEWRHRFLFNKELLINLLKKHVNANAISFYSKENDPAALLGIKDDSQNSFSLCVCVIKNM
jgi:predicted SAM-dependent methyltransferase